ncbi:MAG: hypothetical protein R3C05_12680 [Pirellulaceae bacterium]
MSNNKLASTRNLEDDLRQLVRLAVREDFRARSIDDGRLDR